MLNKKLNQTIISYYKSKIEIAYLKSIKVN